MTKSIIYIHGSLGMGGAEVLRLSVLEEMVNDSELSIRVCVLRDRGELANRVEELGIPLDVLGNRGGLFDVMGVVRLSKYLRKHRPDIAQASQFLTNLQTRIAGWLARTPVVIIEEHGIYKWKRSYHRLLDRWINSRADAVVACSHSVAASAAESLGVDPSRITVIHNCAAKSHFETSIAPHPALNQPHGASRGFVERTGASAQTANPNSSTVVAARDGRERTKQPSFVVGVVGTLRWEKGHRFLLEAWKSLHGAGEIPADARLWIIGTGPLERQLREMAQDMEGVEFLGSQTDIQSILRSMDLFVLPSVNEGFGIAIVEAMCAGLPVIATDCGGIPEVIDSGDTGVLVEPEDSEALAEAISTLYKDPARRARLAREARKEAEKRFTPEAYSRQLMELYERVA